MLEPGWTRFRHGVVVRRTMRHAATRRLRADLPCPRGEPLGVDPRPSAGAAERSGREIPWLSVPFLRMGDARLLQPAAPSANSARLRSLRSSRTCSTPWPRTVWAWRADRRRPAGGDLRLRGAASCFPDAAPVPHHPAEPGDRSAHGRARGGAGGLPVGARPVRHGAARHAHPATPAAPAGEPDRAASPRASMRAWCSESATLSPACCIRCGCGISAASGFTDVLFPELRGPAKTWLYPQDGGGGRTAILMIVFDHVQRVVR